MTRLNSHGAAVCSILLQFFSSRQIGVTHVTWWLAWHSKEVFGPQVQRLIPSQGAFQRSSSRLNHNVKVILGLVWVTIQSISRCWDWKKAVNKYWPRQLLIARKISRKSVFNEMIELKLLLCINFMLKKKALFKVPKICNINFWNENDPLTPLALFWKFVRFLSLTLPLYSLLCPVNEWL